MKTHLLPAVFTISVSFHCFASTDTIKEHRSGETIDNRVTTEDWDRYGMALAREHRYNEAQEAIRHALSKTQIVNSDILLHLALVYALGGNYDASIAQLEHALSIDHNNPALTANLADVLSWKGDLVSATESYKNLVRFSPQDDGYLIRLAQMYALDGQTREARSSYQQLLHLNPNNIDAYIGYANLYMDNHQYAEAEKILRDGLARFPTEMRLSNEMATLAVKKSLKFKDMVEFGELVIFLVILLMLARDTWNERRTLRRRQLAARVLLPALLALAMLMASVYVNIFFNGTYFQQASMISQVLQPIVLGVLVMLTLIWRLRFERPHRQKTILAIGAHPDDIEFGCGATLLRLREEGAATYGLVLTCGERGYEEDVSKSRINEARAAASVMALCEVEVRNFPDTSLHEHKAEIRKTIEEALVRWRPDIIFTHNGHDVHTDHHTVYAATREAARGAYTILCYENPNTPPEFKPGYFFDVGKYIDRKIAALTCHKTQMGKSYAASSVVHAMAGFRGAQARVPLAEGFEVMRVLEKEHK